MALAPLTVQCMPARFEPGPDHHFAASLKDTGGGTQTLGVKAGVAHASAITEDVQCGFN